MAKLPIPHQLPCGGSIPQPVTVLPDAFAVKAIAIINFAAESANGRAIAAWSFAVSHSFVIRLPELSFRVMINIEPHASDLVSTSPTVALEKFTFAAHALDAIVLYTSKNAANHDIFLFMYCFLLFPVL